MCLVPTSEKKPSKRLMKFINRFFSVKCKRCRRLEWHLQVTVATILLSTRMSVLS